MGKSNNYLNHLFRLEGKTVLVTGACGQLGKVFCQGFLDAGSVVFGVDLNLAQNCVIQDDNISYFSLDIVNKKSVENIKKRCSSVSIETASGKIKVEEFLRRPENNIIDKKILNIISDHPPDGALFAVETDIKYEGYIKIENSRVRKFKQLENVKIPPDFNYSSLISLSNESRERLTLIRPESLGQASRLAGVRPSDICILAIYLQTHS